MMKNPYSTLIGVCLLLTACTSPTAETLNTNAPQTPQALQPTAVSTALFQIVKPDGSTFGITVADLKALPLAQVQADDGKWEEGPYLRDVLALAGVTEFKEVSLSGSSNPVTLTFEQVDENTILDFNNHGTMKLSTTYVPKSNWTKDVSEIVVK